MQCLFFLRKLNVCLQCGWRLCAVTHTVVKRTPSWQWISSLTPGELKMSKGVDCRQRRDRDMQQSRQLACSNLLGLHWHFRPPKTSMVHLDFYFSLATVTKISNKNVLILHIDKKFIPAAELATLTRSPVGMNVLLEGAPTGCLRNWSFFKQCLGRSNCSIRKNINFYLNL